MALHENVKIGFDHVQLGYKPSYPYLGIFHLFKQYLLFFASILFWRSVGLVDCWEERKFNKISTISTYESIHKPSD